jgi:hypothetical protein
VIFKFHIPFSTVPHLQQNGHKKFRNVDIGEEDSNNNNNDDDDYEEKFSVDTLAVENEKAALKVISYFKHLYSKLTDDFLGFGRISVGPVNRWRRHLCFGKHPRIFGHFTGKKLLKISTSTNV